MSRDEILKKYTKNKIQKVKNSILELEKFIWESKYWETKIRKDIRESKDRKIKIKKKIEDLPTKPSISLARPEKAFHQKPIPLPRPKKFAHSPIKILKKKKWWRRGRLQKNTWHDSLIIIFPCPWKNSNLFKRSTTVTC